MNRDEQNRDEQSLHQVATVDGSIEYRDQPRRQPLADTYVRDVKRVFTLFIGAGITLFALIGFITGMIAAWQQYVASWGLLWEVLVWALIIGVPLVAFVILIKRAIRGTLNVWHEYENLKDQRADRSLRQKRADAEVEKLQAEADEARARAKQIFFTLPVDERGNVLYHDPYTQTLAPFRLNYQEYPSLSNMHYSIKQDGGYLPAGEDAGDAVDNMDPDARPKIADLITLIERNSFEIPLGASLEIPGECAVVDISDSHIKIIGSSRKGKSCLAAAIIDILRQTHDVNILRIALLDLENKTSKLFEGMAHLAVIEQRGQQIPLHARNPRQVVEYLHLIRNLMDYRYTLPEEEQEVQPHILAYVEEFLSLKSHRDLDKPLRGTLIDDLNELAIRGLKAHIHLMCCAQVDYADENLQAFANNFGLNISFSVRPEAARAAGFLNYPLLAKNWGAKIPGQFVVEGTGCNDFCVAPDYDVKAMLKELRAPKQTPEIAQTASFREADSEARNESEMGRNGQRNETRNESELAPEAHLQAKMLEVMEFYGANPVSTQTECMKKVWRATPGDNIPWNTAKREYAEVQRMITALARRGMSAEGEV